MAHFRSVLVSAIIAGLIGCQSGSRTVSITEYRPTSAVMQRSAPDAQVFELVRWTPIAPVKPPTTQSTAIARKPAKQMPVEVEQVYVDRGGPLGFCRDGDGVLIAVAGPTSRALDEGHYQWRTLPGSSSARTQAAQRRADRVMDALATIAIIALTGGILFLYFHIHRHDDVILGDMQ